MKTFIILTFIILTLLIKQFYYLYRLPPYMLITLFLFLKPMSLFQFQSQITAFSASGSYKKLCFTINKYVMITQQVPRLRLQQCAQKYLINQVKKKKKILNSIQFYHDVWCRNEYTCYTILKPTIELVETKDHIDHITLAE